MCWSWGLGRKKIDLIKELFTGCVGKSQDSVSCLGLTGGTLVTSRHEEVEERRVVTGTERERAIQLQRAPCNAVWSQERGQPACSDQAGRDRGK